MFSGTSLLAWPSACACWGGPPPGPSIVNLRRGAAFAQTLEPLQGRDNNLHPSSHSVSVHQALSDSHCQQGHHLPIQSVLRARAFLCIAKQGGRSPGSHALRLRPVLLLPSVTRPTRIVSITATAPVINAANSVVQRVEFIELPSPRVPPFHSPE